ncbi:MAG: hypothetical protein JXQ73_11210 [Phycisphaerae bacterium]|nr:hypothetical protein [Phycisphaerae bacterium]
MRDPRLLTQLGALRRRIRWLLAVDGVALAAASGILAVLLATVVDYLVWLPAVIRLVVALILCAGWGLAVWLRVIRPMIARIELSEIASILDHRFADLEDRLTSAVLFMRATSKGRTSAAMVDRLLSEAEQATERVSLESVVRWRRPAIMLATAFVVIAGMAGVAVAAPWFIATGLQRYVRPFSATEWPREVLIEPLTGQAKRPAGGWFEARARLVRGQDPSRRVAVCTIWPRGQTDRHLMTYDSKTGAYFHVFKDLRQDFDYWFESGDDSTRDRHAPYPVRVFPRPAVLKAELTLTPPPYVTDAKPRTIVLRDTTISAVEGSRARLVLSTSKPLPKTEQRPSPVTLTLPDGAARDMTPLDEFAARFENTFEIRQSGTLTVRLVDENGFDNLGGTSYSLSVRADETPHVVIVEPQAVAEVTPRASVDVAISADDDFGISRLGVDGGVDPQPSSRPAAFDLTERMEIRRSGGRTIATVRWPWDLRSMALEPGDVVTYHATAHDNYTMQGRSHPPGKSPDMRLKIISPDQFAERVRDEILLLKNAVRQLLGTQELARDEVEAVKGEIDPTRGLDDRQRELLTASAGRQARLAGRTRFLGGRFDKLISRLKANRSQDEEMRQRAIEASQRLASVSSGAMTAAAGELQQAGQAKATPDQVKAMTGAGQRQQAAIEQLRSLLAGMDRWGDFQDVVHNVQQLLDQQERQTETTHQLAAKTLGRKPEELPTPLKAEITQQSRQQRSMAEDLTRLIENMDRLARSLRQSDAAAAGAMDDARGVAEGNQLSGKMKSAADKVAGNQMAQAQTDQRQVEDGLRQMLTRLEGRQMEQLAELSKRLQGAVEKVQALLQDQQKLLDETKKAAADDNAQREQLARRQRGLSRAAKAVADEVGKAERAAQPARGLRRAGSRMSRAGDDLAGGRKDEAAAQQTEAIRELTESLETLKKLRKEAEGEMAAKTLEAVAKEIKTLRDRQSDLNKQLDPIVEAQAGQGDLTRVDLRRLDKLAGGQRDVAKEAEKLRPRLRTAPVYDWVMERLGGDMNDLAGRYDRRLAEAKTKKLAESILQRLNDLVAGLEQEPPDDKSQHDPFADAGGGGPGGGATKTKPVPTVAELLVLKALQADVNRRTERADLDRQLADTVSEEQLEAIRKLGKDQQQIRQLAEKTVKGALQGRSESE